MKPSVEPRPDREVYSITLEPAANDIDENGHVNNVVYVRWLQDVGTAHWIAGLSEEARAPWTWIALHHEIDYRRPVLPGEKVVATTWAEDVDGPRFDRVVVFRGADDGAIRAHGRTTWCLINLASRKPARIPHDVIAPFVK